MRFHTPFIQLPIRFCVDTLVAEVEALPRSAWVPHPQGFAGNDAVPLVSPGGEISDSVKGAMGPTEHLLRCPYIMALMAELGGVWGRSRLMGLAPGAEVPEHVDIHYYWRTHIRIHIPIVTNPAVRFTCGGETVHMAAGECWTFDSFQRHDVQNESSEHRVHLVIDTVGGEHLWELIDAAESGVVPPPTPWMPAPGAGNRPALAYEAVNIPDIMSPWEIRCHIDYLAEHIEPTPMLEPVMKRMDRFASSWAAAWSRFGDTDDGLPIYRGLVETARTDLNALPGSQLTLRNRAPLHLALDALIFGKAVTRGMAERPMAPPAPAARQHATS